MDEFGEQFENVRRENKTLAQEVKDLSDQLNDGGKSIHELQKLVHRLELEKEELQVITEFNKLRSGQFVIDYVSFYREPWTKLKLP